MTYSREALLAWLRNVTPDLRMGAAVVDGGRARFARFTFAAEDYELEATGADPDDAIVRQVVDTVRVAMGLSPLFAESKSVRLEQAIVLASMAGDENASAALTRELLQGRAKKPTAIRTKTSFPKRDIW